MPTAAIFVAMRAMFKPAAAAGIDESYELHVDGHVFEVRVAAQQVLTREGFAHAPAVTLTLDGRTLLALLREGLNPREAVAAGRVRLNGEAETFERFVGLFARSPEPAGTGRTDRV